MKSEGKTAPKRSGFKFSTPMRVAVSLGLVAFMLATWVDYAQVASVLANAYITPLILTVLVLAFGRFLVAYRWYLLVRDSSHDVSFGDLLRLTFVSAFLGFFVPGTVGVEAIRVYGLARRSDLSLAVTSVLVERLTALFVLVGLILIGIAFLPVELPKAVDVASWIGLACLIFATVVLFQPHVRRLTLALLPGAALAPARERLAQVHDQLDVYSRRPGLLLAISALSTVMQLSRVLEGILLAIALGVDADWIYFVIIMPISVLISMMPISIFGLGVREVTFVSLFGIIGVAADTAFAMSLLNFVLTVLVFTLPGGILYMFGGISGRRNSTADDLK